MAKIVEYRKLPLDDLTIGDGQVRTADLDKDIKKLAESIDKQGLLQPIVVCRAEKDQKWEILSGQRRYLAHKKLKRRTIEAAILDERVNGAEAKAISITENLVRRNLSGTELIDGITLLYNKYGSAKRVHEVTGISYDDVRNYVKYPRLLPGLKRMVDSGAVDVRVALKAQDAAESGNGRLTESDAAKLALEMGSMSDAQRKRLARERSDNPGATIAESIERAKTSLKVTQVVVTLTQHAHTCLQQYAAARKTNQDAAAAELIEAALTEHGYSDIGHGTTPSPETGMNTVDAGREESTCT